MTINTFPIRTVDATDLVEQITTAKTDAQTARDDAQQAVTDAEQIVTDLTSEPFAISDTAGLQNALDLKTDTADVQSSPTDTDTNKLMKVGAFGLGGYNNTPTVDSFDAYELASGFYSWGPTTEGDDRPVGTYGSLYVSREGSGSFSQIGISRNGYSISVRSMNTGVIGTWRRVLMEQDIVGTVSQDAGTPTGAIIERGSNANGGFVKYADGTMICWMSGITIDLTIGTPFATSTYPASFSEVPTVLVSVDGEVSGWDEAGDRGEVRPTARGSTTAANFVTYKGASQGDFGSLRYIAIGRWF